ncbi:MAG: hypothetical protein V7637_696 [Mycobacteriales bacterium]|jgi:uncharacterized protein YukE
MATDEINVDYRALRKHADSFDSVGDSAAAIAGRLHERLAAVEPTDYGTDDTGKAFKKEYVTSRDQLVQGIDGLVLMMRGVADGVRLTADAFEGIDKAVTGK